MTQKVFCKIHTKNEMTIGICNRCDGDGFTEFDLDEMDNPLAWHNKGDCYQCNGTGQGFLECDICEEDFRHEQESDNT